MFPLRLLLPGVSLLVSLLFLLLTWTLYPLLNPGTDPRAIMDRLHHSLRQPEGPDLNWLPPESRVTMFCRSGRSESLLGAVLEPDANALAQSWAGVQSHGVVGGRLSLWQPVVGRDGQVLAVAAAQVPLPPPGLEHRLGRLANLKATLLASAICWVVSLLLSLRVTVPIRRLAAATAALEGGALETRAPVSGPRDLRDLALSFNRMASRLEETLEGTRQEKERAEQAVAHHRQFLADISHSLGTPLAAVQGWIHAMQDGIIKPDAYALHFAKISRETAFVSRAVKRLLELSRWESGPPELLVTEFPLLEPALEAVESLEEALLARGMELNFVGLDGSLRVRADRGRVRELFQILLENCVAHAGEGTSVSLVLECRGGRAHVCVSDNGRGIAPAELPQVTSRFYRSGSGGTGLGLSIAERLALAHGGELRVVSAGQGTRVLLSLGLVAGANYTYP